MLTFDASKIKSLGIYTSGGDAPGMNAAIRAVARFAIARGLTVKGILHGYEGMIAGDIIELGRGSLANIIQRGGTLLKTGRSTEFLKPEARTKAASQLKKNHIDALVCIGGDGSFRGAHLLGTEHSIPIVGVPGTIDNDIFGTDYTIGFDTAINIALESIDRIRDTAASHDRLFIVEVMGRDSGFIAAYVGLAGGAEEIFFPENKITIDDAIEHIERGLARGKTSSILITAEGSSPGLAYAMAKEIKTKSGYEATVCVLGHIQRGGNPTALDRVNASRLGAFAVEKILEGHGDVMAAIQSDKIVMVDFATSFNQKKPMDMSLVQLAQILST
jgi:6-phosphofructokinase 1